MSTTRVRTVAALLAGLALSVAPAMARDGRHESGDRRQGQSGGERRRPRNSGNREGARGNRAEADRGDRGGAQAEPVPRSVPRERNESRRLEPERGERARESHRAESQRGDDRWRGSNRPYVVVPQHRDYRYNSYPSRSYVTPYGYRPRGYRPGWSLNLYFGRPYSYSSRYGSRGYYNRGAYGYYSIPSGFAYGSLRIVDAPRDAQVFVDGYYAGVVDDYDGVFQRLNLEPGSHRIEIDVNPGAPPIEFDVHVAPGQTVTFHARY